MSLEASVAYHKIAAPLRAYYYFSEFSTNVAVFNKGFRVYHVSYFDQVFRDKFCARAKRFPPKCGIVVENRNNFLLKFFELYGYQLTNSLKKKKNELTD